MYSMCWFVGLCHSTVTLSHFIPCPPISHHHRLRGGKSSLCYIDLFQCFGNRHSVRSWSYLITPFICHIVSWLQPVINKHTNYQSKMNFWFIKQWAGIRAAAREHNTVHKAETKCVANNFQRTTSSGCVGRMSFSHEGADIFCMSHSFQLQTHASLRPQPCLL